SHSPELRATSSRPSVNRQYEAVSVPCPWISPSAQRLDEPDLGAESVRCRRLVERRHAPFGRRPRFVALVRRATFLRRPLARSASAYLIVAAGRGRSSP